jgi:hypothetical protein
VGRLLAVKAYIDEGWQNDHPPPAFRVALLFQLEAIGVAELLSAKQTQERWVQRFGSFGK